MMWKPYVISGIVFAIVYVLTRDMVISMTNGFVAVYLMYKIEQKSEQDHANLEVGI